MAIGTDADDRPTDPGTQATWLHNHFQREHPAPMREVSATDGAIQAARPHVDEA